jgi:F-type H+-transporting ATPase subunit a
MSFSWTSLIAGPEKAHVATAAIVGGTLVISALAAKSALGIGEQRATPSGVLSLRGIFEALTEFIDGLAKMVIGDHGRAYVPMFAAVFIWVLTNNLVGILPGMTTATENFNTTLAMGLLIFLVYNYLGIKENGWGYLKHFMGPVIWLAPMMFIIEIISHLVRPMSLGLRLANVMRGDHTVVGLFLSLGPILLPVPFYLMGIFVSVVQAFVFTLLSMVYVALATSHDH